MHSTTGIVEGTCTTLFPRVDSRLGKAWWKRYPTGTGTLHAHIGTLWPLRARTMTMTMTMSNSTDCTASCSRSNGSGEVNLSRASRDGLELCIPMAKSKYDVVEVGISVADRREEDGASGRWVHTKLTRTATREVQETLVDRDEESAASGRGFSAGIGTKLS